MAIAGSSVTGAASSAATPATALPEQSNVTYPATEIYPGPVDPTQYLEGVAQTTPGGVGTVTQTSVSPYMANPQVQIPGGGGFQDATWMSGTDGPSIPWDSSAGEPFAPSGALNPALHGQDLGSDFIGQYVVPAAIGDPVRRTSVGQTTVTVAETQTEKVGVSPNNRRNLDEYQTNNHQGYDPYEIPYSERPILNNLGYAMPGLVRVPTGYGVAGGLPDNSPHDYAAMAYEAPPDPSVGTTKLTPATTSGGGWVLG